MLRCDARRAPEARQPAVVVGAGALGVKVARALPGSAATTRLDFLGYFDDRTDDRVHRRRGRACGSAA